MTTRLLSLAEISVIEHSGALGAATFPYALRALMTRWEAALRDPETATRLLFYIHEGSTMPPQYSRIEAATLPDAGQVIAEAGGEDALSADALFGLGLLLHWQAWPFGDDAQWTTTARRWAQLAVEREPESRVFREWQFFRGERADTLGPRIYIEPEAHARFHGRGAFGARMLDLLIRALQPASATEKRGP